ncbi:MAG: baseplate J/gp47 family protein [Prevotella sp.]|nr:baseplate J/gp47 family protein [Prevotella sp.]
MASDEASIEKLDGTVIKRSELVQQMIAYYKEAYQQELTDVCDLNEGSEMRTLLESISVDLFDIYYQDYELSKQKFVKYATGQYLDLLGCEAHLTRKNSTSAEGQVTFTASTVYGSSQKITSGTILLHNEKGYEYVLKDNVTIKSGETTAVGNIISKIPGKRYNADSYTITAFANTGSVRNNLKVTNNTPITGGSDAETDAEFRERILNAKRERAYGTIPAYQNLVYQLDQVHDIQFVNPENVEHYVYDNSVVSENENDKLVRCTDCTRVVYVNAESKPCPDSVVEDVEYTLTLQTNLVIGHEFHVEKAECYDIYFYVSLYLEDGVSSVSQSDVVEAIKAYMDGGTVEKDADTKRIYPGLNIRGSIEKKRLIEAIEYVPGVDQVDHIMRMRYNTDLPTDSKKWEWPSDDYGTYTDSDGYFYTCVNGGDNESVKTDYWGTREFNTIDFKSGVVGRFAPMYEADGYDIDGETGGSSHQIKLEFV